MFEIRPAHVDDIAVLVPMVERYWQFERIDHFDPQAVTRQLERLLGDPRLGSGWIASATDRAAGYLLVVHVFSLEHLGLTAEIDELFVQPEYRGSGVGQRLLGAAEAACRAAGCTNVSLQLARDNDAARAFYRRAGYVERDGYELMDKPCTAA